MVSWYKRMEEYCFVSWSLWTHDRWYNSM